jgi:uncharacterized membrane protein YccC
LNGEDCPYCGLPAEAAKMMDEARERHVSEAIIERLAESEKRLAALSNEAAFLRGQLARARSILGETYDPERHVW